MAKLGQIKSGTMRVGNTTASGYGIVYADEVIGHRRVNTYAELKTLPEWCLYNKAGGDSINTAIGQLWYVYNGDSSHVAGLYQLVGTNISSDASWKLFKNGADVSTHDTTYTFAGGSNGSFTVTPKGGSAQTVSIGKPTTAGTADHAKTADAATKADSATSATNANHATSADSATKATKDANNNNIVDTYATKREISALTSALVYKGTVDAKYALPTKNVKIGDVYVVAATGTFAGQTCEPGDMIIAQTASDAEGTPAPTWTVVQTNINGAVTTSGQLGSGMLVVGNGNNTIKAVGTNNNGFVKVANGGVIYDNNTYLTTTSASNTYAKKTDLSSYLTSVPTAKDNVVGGFKTGYTQSGKNYAVVLNDKNQAYVYVPWTDTNTTYPLASASTNGLMSKDDKSKLDDLGLSGNSFNDTLTNTKGLTLNLVGTSSSYNIPIVKPSTDASTYGLMSGADKKKLDGIAEDANKYSLPAANANYLGGIRIGYSPLAGTKNYPVVLDTNNKAYVSVPWTDNNTTYTADGVYVTLTSGQFGLARDKKTLIDNAVQRSEIGAIPEEEITKLF